MVKFCFRHNVLSLYSSLKREHQPVLLPELEEEEEQLHFLAWRKKKQKYEEREEPREEQRTNRLLGR